MRRLVPAVIVLSIAARVTVQPASGGAFPSDDEVADAQRFRRGFHLDSGDALVRQSFTDRRQFPDDSWGVPLTDDEAADMAARLRRQDAAKVALEWAAQQPGYGGAHIDQSRGGMPVFLFTEALAAATDRIGELLPDHPYVVERVERTFSELLEISDRAAAEPELLQSLGVTVFMIGPDVIGNGLRVVAEQASPDNRRTLEQRYGLPVSLRESPPAELDGTGYQSCGNPLKGGVRIDRSNYNGQIPMCTSAWIARKGEGDGPRVVVTVGHCFELNDGTGANINWKHDGDTFGNAQDYEWVADGIVDVGIISIDDWSGVQAQNRLHFRSSVPGSAAQVYPFVATKSNAAQIKGMAIRRSGARRKLRCGKIDAVNQQNVISVGKRMDDLWVVDFDGDGGDSGGPYFTSTSDFGDAATALGIHSGSDSGWNPDGGHGWYSTVQNIDAETPWEICLVATGNC